MRNKLNKTVIVYSDNKSDYYYSFKIAIVTGLLLIMLFGYLAYNLGQQMPLFYLLFVCAVVVSIVCIFSSRKAAPIKFEEITTIKSSGVKHRGNIKYVSSSPLPRIFEAVKIIKTNKKKLLDNIEVEEAELDIQHINGSKK